jgi:toxin ParE1/3/4
MGPLLGSTQRACPAQMRIVWTEPALRDLSAALAYMALESPSAAAQQIDYVLAAVATLPRFPESGRPGRRAGARALVVNRTSFIVPYRVRGEVVELLRVLHGRQRWPDSL